MIIVSGFVGDINQRSDRDQTKYIELGKQLIAAEIPTVLFVSSRFIAELSAIIRENSTQMIEIENTFSHRQVGGAMDGMVRTYTYVQIGHVYFVYFEKTDLFLWPFRELGHRFAVHSGNPQKDTLEYMFVQCQKSEWMNIAVSLISSSPQNQYGKNTVFAWMDFGVFHMFGGNCVQFHSALHKMQRESIELEQLKTTIDCNDSKVVFAQCWDPNLYYNGNIYKDVNWSFAGSVFYGREKAIAEFAWKMREKCLQILRETNSLMWEINVWLILYRENPQLFSFYLSDHNERIIPEKIQFCIL